MLNIAKGDISENGRYMSMFGPWKYQVCHNPSNDFYMIPDDNDVHNKYQYTSFMGENVMPLKSLIVKNVELQFYSYGNTNQLWYLYSDPGAYIFNHLARS